MLKARAGYAGATGDAAQAVALLEQAKTLAGAGWDPESEALLTGFRRQ